MSPKKENIHTYEDWLEAIPKLTPEEQARLMEVIASRLKQTLTDKHSRHSLLELEGLGAEIWKDVDVQHYVEEERKSWN